MVLINPYQSIGCKVEDCNLTLSFTKAWRKGCTPVHGSWSKFDYYTSLEYINDNVMVCTLVLQTCIVRVKVGGCIVRG